MRPLVVVFPEPGLDDLADLGQGLEHVGIEDFVAEGPVEALDEGVLVRLPGLDELKFDLALLAPLGEDRRGQLAAVIQAQGARLSVKLDELFQ